MGCEQFEAIGAKSVYDGKGFLTHLPAPPLPRQVSLQTIIIRVKNHHDFIEESKHLPTFMSICLVF